MNEQRYQVMPDLSAEDFAALKADIQVRGVMVAVEYDSDGNVIDGHHRVRACNELGITEWPKIVRQYDDETAKRTHARQLNLARRHLDQAAKRALIADELRERPETSNRRIAGGLGVDDKTVGAVREELIATAEIPQLKKTVGKDGKARTSSPARRKTMNTVVAPHVLGAALRNGVAAHAIRDIEALEKKYQSDSMIREALATARQMIEQRLSGEPFGDPRKFHS